MKLILTFTLLFLSSCFFSEDGKIEINPLNSSFGTSNAQVSSVSIVNDQLVVNGSGLSGITKVQITGPSSFDHTFSIESKSDSNLIANGVSNIAFALDAIFSLTVTDANGSATYNVTFTLQDDAVTTSKILDGAVTAAKLSDMGAGTGQVLKYNGTTWVPGDLNALTYAGTWDASTATAPNVAPAAGEYYIVSVAAAGIDISDGSGSRNFVLGDWLVYNGSTTRWDKIDNASYVTSFNGRSGAVTPATNDYTWAQIDKSASVLSNINDVEAPAGDGSDTGKVLKWNNATSTWELGDDLSGGGAGSVTSTEIADGSITNDDVNAAAAIAYSKLNIADGDLTIAKTSGLQTTLDAKLPLAGGTMTGDLTMGANNIITSGNVDGVDVSTLATSVSTNTSTIAGLDTDDITEATNQYFTNARAIAAPITGFTSGAGTVAATDTVLQAIQKLDGNIAANTSSISSSGDILDGGNTTGSAVTIGTNDAQSLNLETNNSTAMTILSGGDIGIGTASPFNKLHVANGQIVLSDGQLLSWTNTDGQEGRTAIVGREDVDYIAIKTDNGERMRVTASGNIGIGTTSPNRLLEVAGPVRVTAAALPGSPAAGDIAIDSGDSNKLKWYNGTAWQEAGGTSGAVTSVTGTAPIVSSGGTTPAISIAQANGSTDGFLDSADWTTFNNKQAAITTGTTAQYLRGDLSLSTFGTDVIGSAITGFTSGAGTVAATDTVLQAVQKLDGNIAANTSTISGLDTDDITEATNQYFTNARAIAAPITGFTSGAGTVAATDTVLQAIQKLDGNIAAAGDILDGGNTTGSAVTIGTNDAQSLNLETNNSTAMTILSSGNVGVGTSSPSSNLDLQGNLSNSLTGTVTVGAGTAAVTGSGTAFTTELAVGDAIKIGTETFTVQAIASATALTLDSNHVAGATGVAATSDPNLVSIKTGDAQEVFTVNSEGKVGIGTTTPGRPLHIRSSNAGSITDDSTAVLILEQGTNPKLQFQSANTQSQVGLLWSDPQNSTQGALYYDHVNDSMDFHVNGSERLTVDSSGNVGIGTSTPSTALDVSGTVTATAFAGDGSALTGISATGVAAGAGTVGAPSMSFSTDTNTGFYSSGADQIGVSANGASIFDFTATGLTSPTTGGSHITTGNGTAAAPTFSFAGDTDTGWYRAAADTLAAATGGSERVRIDSSGNVGVGVTSPGEKLVVDGNIAVTTGVGAYGAGRYQATSTGDLIGLTLDSTSREWDLVSIVSTTPDYFAIRDNTASAERLVVTEDGNVGIGTVAPSSLLHVSQASVGIKATIEGNGNTAINTGAILSVKSSGTTNWGSLNFTDGVTANAYIGYIPGSGASTRLLGFANNSATPSMVIDGSGNVGIGTTSPDSPLHVIDNSSNGIILERTSATARKWNMLVLSDGSLDFYDQTAGADRMVIDTDGDIGVGTTTPNSSSILDLTSTTKGFAPPRMTTTQRDAISSPATGLQIYNTTTSSVDYYDGSSWQALNGEVKYIKLGMSADQTVDTGNYVAFNTTRSSSGLTTTGNGVNLKAGKTYRIEAAVNIASSTGNGYLGYSVYNGSTTIGNAAYTNDPDSNGAHGFKAEVLEFYTPSVDETVYIRVTDDNIGTGQVQDAWNTYFAVTEMVGSGSGGGGGTDNMGNHTATQNVVLGSNYISGDGGNEGLSVDSSGNVGIGTTSPGSTLHVNASNGGSNVLLLALGGKTAGDTYMQFEKTADQGGHTSIQSVSAYGSTYGNLLLNPNGANVGVGTGSPTERFHVSAGTVDTAAQFESTDNISRITLADNSDSAYFAVDGSSGFLNLGFAADMSTGLNVTSAGNVGVGTSSPGAKLHLQENGDVSIRLRDTASNANAEIWDIGIGANGSGNSELTFRQRNDDGTSKREVMRFSESGNIGIGTTSPDNLLHLESATPVLKFTDTDSANEWFASNQNGDFTISQAGVSDWITVKPAGGVGIATSSPDGRLEVEDAGASSYVLGATQDDENIYGLRVGNDTADTSAGDGFLVKVTNGAVSQLHSRSAGADGQISFHTGDLERVRIDSSGNVGIGTATPSGTLDVGPSGKTICLNGTCRSTWPTGSGTGAFTDSGSLAYYNGGNVGIGNSSPNAELHIGSTSAVGDATNPAIQIGGTGSYRLGMYTTAEGGVIDVANGDDGLIIHTKVASEAMRVTSAGNVGIGTASPSTSLHVYHATTNTVAKFESGDANANITLADNSTTNTPYIQATANDLILGHASGGDQFSLTAAGNVGIGTTNPADLLEIAHSGADTSAFRIGDPTTLSSDSGIYMRTSGNAYFGTHSAAGDVRIMADTYGSNSNGITVKNGGNIGIGTTSPNAKLSVAGTINGGADTDTVISSDVDLLFNLDADNDQSGRAARFFGNSGEVFRVQEDGNVGIGTTSPAGPLHVSEGSGTDGFILDSGSRRLKIVGSNSGSGYVAIESMDTDNTNNGTRHLVLEPNGGNVGIGTTSPAHKLDINGDLRVKNENHQIIFHDTDSAADEWSITTFNSDSLTFYENGSSGTPRFILETGGNVGIGTTAPTALLSVNGTANKPGGGSWATFSDRRLKTIHGKFDRGLEEMMKLETIVYNYNDDNPLGLANEGDHIGFVAQEIEKVIPEAVSYTDDGYLTLNNDPIIWTILNGSQEQQRIIEENIRMMKVMQGEIFENSRKIASLEEENKEIKEKYNKLEEDFKEQGKEVMQLKDQLNQMKSFLCATNKDADFCQ